MAARKEKKPLTASNAFRFVLILGIANCFADMTYEGARSVTGPFLATLGASAAIVGFTAGFGDLIGYGLRSITGLISDRTHKYWLVTIVGYIVNMLAVPALALAGNWPLAAGSSSRNAPAARFANLPPKRCFPSPANKSGKAGCSV